MKLQLKRKFFADTYTIGALSINSLKFCDVVEDKVRKAGEAKVYGETAIPFGTYDVILNVSPKFKRKLPRLLNVPNFEGVLIHRGNTAKDSAGCLLVGENKIKGGVINSTKYELELVSLIEAALNKGEKITIEII